MFFESDFDFFGVDFDFLIIDFIEKNDFKIWFSILFDILCKMYKLIFVLSGKKDKFRRFLYCVGFQDTKFEVIS